MAYHTHCLTQTVSFYHPFTDLWGRLIKNPPPPRLREWIILKSFTWPTSVMFKYRINACGHSSDSLSAGAKYTTCLTSISDLLCALQPWKETLFSIWMFSDSLEKCLIRHSVERDFHTVSLFSNILCVLLSWNVNYECLRHIHPFDCVKAEVLPILEYHTCLHSDCLTLQCCFFPLFFFIVWAKLNTIHQLLCSCCVSFKNIFYC